MRFRGWGVCVCGGVGGGGGEEVGEGGGEVTLSKLV